MYGLRRYPGRLLLDSKHPYDKWKSDSALRDALASAGFVITGTRGSCYLPGDISYYQPFKMGHQSSFELCSTFGENLVRQMAFQVVWLRDSSKM